MKSALSGNDEVIITRRTFVLLLAVFKGERQEATVPGMIDSRQLVSGTGNFKSDGVWI